MNSLFIKLFAAIFFFALCHCQPKGSPSKNSLSRASQADILSIALESEPETLDPRKATDANGMRLAGLIYNGLTKTTGSEILPDGAEKWEKDGLTYTFHLKPLKFSFGSSFDSSFDSSAARAAAPRRRPVTKEDILFSFQEFRKKSSPFFSVFQNIKSVEATGSPAAIKVKISLKKSSAAFLTADLPVIKILPKKETEKSGSKNPFGVPYGSGLFRLAKKTSREILLERVENTPPLPRYLSFQIIRDNFTRVQKLLAGELDIAPSAIPLEKLSQFKADKFYVIPRPGLSSAYLLLNLKRAPLDQKEVRMALAHSINREDIIKYKLKDYGEAAVSLIPPSLAAFGERFLNKNLKFPAFSPESARKTIQSLGLKGASLVLSVSNNRGSIDKGKVLASQISKTGLKVSVQSYEWGTFYRDISHGRYDMALMKWVGINDPDIYRVAFHTENRAPKGRNRSFYSNKTADLLLERGAAETDPKKRKEIYDRIQEIILKDMAIIPLWHDMEVSVIKNSIKNYTLPANGSFHPIACAFKKPRSRRGF